MPSPDFDSRVYAQLSSALDPGSLARTFDRLAPWYRRFLAPWLPADRQALMLDIPCGAGNLMYCLRALGYQGVRGIDADRGKVALARSLGLDATVGDAFETLRAMEAGSVAAVFAVDFLEHLSKEAALEFCTLAHRALRPGGHLLCRTPSADGPFASHDRYSDLTHRWSMTAGVACVLMKMAGFGDTQVLDESPVPYKWQNRIRRLLFLATTRLASAFLDLIGIGAPAIWTRSMWVVARR